MHRPVQFMWPGQTPAQKEPINGSLPVSKVNSLFEFR